MDGLLMSGLGLAWTQVWQVTALALLVWAVVRFVGCNRPHLANLLWLVVLLKCITPPVVSSPTGIFCWLQEANASRARAPLAVGTYAALPRAPSRVEPLLDVRAGEQDDVVVRLSRARTLPPAGQAIANGSEVRPAWRAVLLPAPSSGSLVAR